MNFSQFESGVVNEQKTVQADVQLLSDGADRLAFGLPRNLRAQEILLKIKLPDCPHRIFTIIFAGNRMKDATAIERFDDFLHAGLEPQLFDPVFD